MENQHEVKYKQMEARVEPLSLKKSKVTFIDFAFF